jgi:hypothetical protein
MPKPVTYWHPKVSNISWVPIQISFETSHNFHITSTVLKNLFSIYSFCLVSYFFLNLVLSENRAADLSSPEGAIGQSCSHKCEMKENQSHIIQNA